MENRISKVVESNAAAGIDAMLVLQPENRYYLSGFTGSTGALLITEKKSFIIVDFRYVEQALKQSPHMDQFKMKDNLADSLVELQERLNFRSLGFELDYISYKLHKTLQERLCGVNLCPVEGLIEKFRQVKDKSELAAIQKAMSLLDEGFNYICEFIKPGISEIELSLELELFMRKRGAEGIAFPFIVASGPRSSLPHGIASERIIQLGDVITIDFGVVVGAYMSDMTRTVALGIPSKKIKEIYSIVLKAQLAGLAAVKAGVPASSVDKATREVIEAHGYGEYFGHSTGHGVGLEVHEQPRLSAKDNTVLRAGMVVTVEPGIYLPGIGGVRIEDSVVVEQNGLRILTKSPKDRLIEL